jgi:hypothetical protein
VATVRVAAVREKEGSGEVFPAQAQKTLLADARVSEWVEMQVQLDFDQRCCALLCSVLFCPVPSFSCSRARSPDSEVGGRAEVDVGAAGWGRILGGEGSKPENQNCRSLEIICATIPKLSPRPVTTITGKENQVAY